MGSIRISSRDDEQVGAELRAMADETHQSVSGLLERRQADLAHLLPWYLIIG